IEWQCEGGLHRPRSHAEISHAKRKDTFHRVHHPSTWAFTEVDVVGILRSKLKSGMPTWIRLMIVKGPDLLPSCAVLVGHVQLC
ncbi:hypothetical protein ACFL2H_06640, partial [Planctomycetota bacterium]